MKLVVKQHRPVRRATILISFVVGSIAAVAVAFHQGKLKNFVPSVEKTVSPLMTMDEDIDLSEEIGRLQTQIAKNRREMAVDQKAKLEYRQSVTALEDEVANLKLELAFYRDIFASSEAKIGPQVRGFRVTDFDGQGRYQYRLVLTHVSKDDKVADGSVSVEIRGDREGSDRWIRLSEISEPGADSLSFRFKHFRRIEGIMAIPDNFKPREVYVAVHQRGRNQMSFNHVYKWASLIN